MAVKQLMSCAQARSSRHPDSAVPSPPASERPDAARARAASVKCAMPGRRSGPTGPGTIAGIGCAEQVRMAATGLDGRLRLPPGARGLVLFVDTGGLDGDWRGDAYVERVLHRQGLGTLRFELTGQAGAFDGPDIGLPASRIGSVLGWIGRRPDLMALPTGLMAADTMVAAAMVAAARRSETVRALVSRGGHPDLAADHLSSVVAPTLLIVGSADRDVLAANRAALRLLTCNKRLEVVPGATNGFEEPGALEGVAELAAQWFDRHLAKRSNS